MPSRRDQISMSPDEVRAYLGANRKAVLVSNGLNGFPHPMPMNYVFRDDAILMTTFRKSQKVLNLQRDPRCTVLVETGERYTDLKSVLAYANAEIIDDLAYTQGVIMQVSGGEPGATAGAPALRASAEATAPKRVVLRFAAERYVSWDHSKLQGRY
jgi:nitroimidazol reductase NimA-like FMN-containing flavoprotein (pyridoxamine 5'-phosphate oxidase superfamily)